MKTLLTMGIALSLILIFTSGMLLGALLRNDENYFNEYPSPLACHRDGTCGLKVCNLAEYNGSPLCK